MTMAAVGVQRRPGTTNKDRASFVVTNNEEDYVPYEKAWRDVCMARDLWSLVDPQHSMELRRFMKEQVSANRDDEGEYILSPVEVKYLLSLLQGLDTAILKITNNYWRLRPEYVASTMEEVPDLVTTWKQDDGTIVYTLENGIMKVLGVVDFLQEAARLDRSVSTY